MTDHELLYVKKVALPGMPVAADVDTAPVAVAAAVAVDDALVVARETRSAVAAAAGAADDREPIADAGDEVVVVAVVLVQLADGDEVVGAVVVETSASISEPMLDETSPAATADD